MIERDYIRFYNRDGQLKEHLFRSSMNWPKSCRFYALALDPEAIGRCKAEALKTDAERAVEQAAAYQRTEQIRLFNEKHALPVAAPVPQVEVEQPRLPMLKPQ